MDQETAKGIEEKRAFMHFIKLAGLDVIPESVIKRPPNNGEPDILCQYTSGEFTAFELARIRDPNLAAIEKRWKPENGEFIYTEDPSPKIARNKALKQYNTKYPVELLLYISGPVITPYDVILPTIQPIFGSIKHSYRRVWLMSDTEFELVYGTN